MRESVDFQPRMTMSQVNVADDKDRQVRLWLLSASPMDGATHYRLAGRFTANGQTWEVNRRYSQFLALRDKLVKFLTSSPDTCPGCENYLHALTLFAFPKKHFFASRTPLVVNYRVKALRSFVNLLAAWTFSNSPKCPTCGGYAFDIVRNFFVDDAHALSGSDMDYIRDSMSLGTFTGGGERGSAFTRRHSWIPAAAQTALMQGGGGSQRGSQSTQWGTQSMRGTQSTRGSQAQARPSMQLRQTMANMPPPRGAGRARGRPDQRTNAINDAAYEAFDDYLPERPAHSKPSHKNTEAAADTTKFKTLTQAEAQAQAEAERRRAENEQAAASRSSTRGSSRSSSGQFRSTVDPLQRQISGASSSDASMRRSELQQQQQLQYQQLQQHQQHQQHHQQHQQHHQVRMQSPPPKPRRQATPLFDSFVSDHSTTPSMAAEPVFVHGDELRRLGMASSDDEGKLDYSEDEIDVTGLALASPRRPRPKASSGEGLWQPWELAKVA